MTRHRYFNSTTEARGASLVPDPVYRSHVPLLGLPGGQPLLHTPALHAPEPGPLRGPPGHGGGLLPLGPAQPPGLAPVVVPPPVGLLNTLLVPDQVQRWLSS